MDTNEQQVRKFRHGFCSDYFRSSHGKKRAKNQQSQPRISRMNTNTDLVDAWSGFQIPHAIPLATGFYTLKVLGSGFKGSGLRAKGRFWVQRFWVKDEGQVQGSKVLG